MGGIKGLLIEVVDLLLGEVRQEQIHHVDVGDLRLILDLCRAVRLLSLRVNEKLDSFGDLALPLHVTGK